MSPMRSASVIFWWVSEFSGKWNILAQSFFCVLAETLHGYASGKAGTVVVSNNFRLLINADAQVQQFLKPTLIRALCYKSSEIKVKETPNLSRKPNLLDQTIPKI